MQGLEFYSHKETPGLGAEVDNPKWKSIWPGKRIYKNEVVELTVLKGPVPSDASDIGIIKLMDYLELH